MWRVGKGVAVTRGARGQSLVPAVGAGARDSSCRRLYWRRRPRPRRARSARRELPACHTSSLRVPRPLPHHPRHEPQPPNQPAMQPTNQPTNQPTHTPPPPSLGTTTPATPATATSRCRLNTWLTASIPMTPSGGTFDTTPRHITTHHPTLPAPHHHSKPRRAAPHRTVPRQFAAQRNAAPRNATQRSTLTQRAHPLSPPTTLCPPPTAHRPRDTINHPPTHSSATAAHHQVHGALRQERRTPGLHHGYDLHDLGPLVPLGLEQRPGGYGGEASFPRRRATTGW